SVDREVALLGREDFLLLAVPRDREAMAAVHGARLGEQNFLVRLVRVAGAVPHVALLVVAVGHLVEAEEDAAVVGELAARALGDEPLALGVVEVVEDLVRLGP